MLAVICDSWVLPLLVIEPSVGSLNGLSKWMLVELSNGREGTAHFLQVCRRG